jgi:membrane peptidoglycan carboxypeptidase
MKRNKLWRIVRMTLLLAIIVALVITVPIIKTGYDMYKDATTHTSLQVRIERLKSEENYVALEAISPDFLTQVIESEDRRFYTHNGINLISTTRALLKNLMAGTTVEGGSSITQQLAKNMYFSFEKRYERKVAELFVAFDLEKIATKDEILEMYCNIAYFGEGCYGLREATLHYYNLEPLQISSEQAASLVKTLKSPNYYNPNM